MRKVSKIKIQIAVAIQSENSNVTAELKKNVKEI
jgi:hypothetical protein